MKMSMAERVCIEPNQVSYTNEGRIVAKANGIKFGRKRKIDRDKLLKYKEKGIIGTALAKEMGISRATVYKILKEEKNRAIVN